MTSESNKDSEYPSKLMAVDVSWLINFYWDPNCTACNEIMAERLLRHDLIKMESYAHFKLLDRGQIFVEHLLNIPLPTLVWSMEEQK